jgi:hypothetical protein
MNKNYNIRYQRENNKYFAINIAKEGKKDLGLIV